MSLKEYHWLPHLQNSIPSSVGGYTTSLYSIALEGWRRGLNLKFIKSKRNKSNTMFELSSAEKTHRFVASRGDMITREAMAICKDKYRAKTYLEKANVPTPEGKEFAQGSSLEDIIIYAKQVGYPLVVKPIDGTGGKGVIAGIENQKELEEAVVYVKNDLGYKHLLIERYFPGEDYRVYVIGDEVVGITKRIPANILGDGKSTVRELIKQKNLQRRESPILGSSLIKIDLELKNMLKQQNLQLNSIPTKNQQVLLKSKNNISAGGDPVDITDEVSDYIKNIAIAGLKAIPGLPHGALDLMVNKEKDKAVIIEINTQASIRTHLFPMKGTARDVPSKLIDYYFPDSKRNSDVPLYFDFGPVWDEFSNGTAQEVEISNIPKGELILTRFIVSGKIQRVGYGAWVRRQARDLSIHGFIRHLQNGKASIVVCGNDVNIREFKKILSTENSRRSIVLNVVEKPRNTPVPIGFEIKNVDLDKVIQDGYFPVRLKDPSSQNLIQSKKVSTKSTKRNVKQNKEKELDYEKEYYKIINSTSWRITKPVRSMGRIFKKIIK